MHREGGGAGRTAPPFRVSGPGPAPAIAPDPAIAITPASRRRIALPARLCGSAVGEAASKRKPLGDRAPAPAEGAGNLTGSLACDPADATSGDPDGVLPVTARASASPAEGG